ncbi:hypothetical protein PUN28_019234 [Cardiocondyla obscurior]|uniref:Uncharacterized protein n=1 Tax=Cardiocondyla obscurior TaxID=286306 RepID=A0AAW2EDA2_9HYME
MRESDEFTSYVSVSLFCRVRTTDSANVPRPQAGFKRPNIKHRTARIAMARTHLRHTTVRYTSEREETRINCLQCNFWPPLWNYLLSYRGFLEMVPRTMHRHVRLGLSNDYAGQNDDDIRRLDF